MKIEKFCEIFNISLSQLYELSDYQIDDKSVFNIFYQIDRLSEEDLLTIETNPVLFMSEFDTNKRYVILFHNKRGGKDKYYTVVKSFFIEGFGIL